jgi:hypothetical protein
MEIHMQSQQPGRVGAGRRTGFANMGELDDLLELAKSDSSGRTPLAPVHPQPAAPETKHTAPKPVVELPKARNALFDVYRKLQQDLTALVVETRKIESHLFGDRWESVIKTPETKSVDDIAYLAMENLFVQAEQRYAPAGGTLTIDRNDVWRALGMEERHHWRNIDKGAKVPFDLDNLHAHLDATYGGDAGETTAYRQQAKVLIDFFGFGEAEKMVATARHIECTVQIWSMKKDYAPKGTLEVSHHNHERIRNAFKAFACAMAWADEHELRAAIAHSPLTGYCFTFQSRHRESYPGLDIVLFKENWKVRFSHPVAEKLKLFLGQYGA